MINKIKTLVFVLAITATCSFAGENPVLRMAQADIKKVNDTYNKYSEYSMETVYMVFEKHGVSNMIETKNGFYLKKDNNCYTKIDQIEVIKTGDKIISVNNDGKMLSVGDNKELDLDPMQVNADSLLTICSDIQVESLGDGIKKYKLFFDDYEISDYSQIDIVINTKQSRVNRLILYYKQSVNLKSDFYAEETKPRVEILYKNFKTSVTNADLLNELKYINMAGEKLTPSPKYKSYKLIDVRTQPKTKK